METCYEECRDVIKELVHFYNDQAIKMMLLKGYGLSRYYPVSARRPIGDIDIYNFGLWQFADQMVHERFGIEIDYSHEHHTVFTFNDALTD